MNAQSRPKAPTAQLFQSELFGVSDAAPAGFRYQAGLIDATEETQIVEQLGALAFAPFDFHGHLANRRVVGFGLRYDYASRAVEAAPPIPEWLLPLRDTVADFCGRAADAFVQVLINEYQPGAGIGWHKDRPQFGEVIGVSLLAPCTLRFRRRRGDSWDRQSVIVEPRSAYLLSGPSRNVWQHSVPPLGQHRYSITFRTLASG